ncbi:MAG: TetR/AcrR family transcriptional regulator, partial [Oscillospiraceae bacterium]|nr:TetR/AcrR family transcriptional regulator [Oscillospiraceae bacterium]
MKKGERSKQHLIECAAELFWQRGYNATGVSEILEKAGLPKGSFYYYFGSKRELASAVIDYYSRTLCASMRKLADGADWETFSDRVFDFVNELEEVMGHVGCPFAAVGMEMAFTEPDIAREYFAALEESRRLFTEVLLASGLDSAQAEELSKLLFSVYEGRLLIYRISGDRAQAEELRKEMKDVFLMWMDRYAEN